MGVVTLSDGTDKLGALPGTDVLGNTGYYEAQARGYYWSFTFFNNSSHTQYIHVDPDAGRTKPVKVPASTSFDMTIADLILDQVKRIRILGTSGDGVTMVMVDNPIPASQVFLGKDALSLLGLTSTR